MHIFTMDGAGANLLPLPICAAYGAHKAGVIFPICLCAPAKILVHVLAEALWCTQLPAF